MQNDELVGSAKQPSPCRNEQKSRTISGSKAAYTTAQVCQLLSISPRTLKRLCDRQLIRKSKALRTGLFPASEIRRFLEETL